MWGSHGGEYRIMWHCMVWWIGANSTEEPAAFICSTVAREGVEAAVTYWGLSNRICYITLQQWHTGAFPTEYARLHCDRDILGLGQQSTLHHSMEVTYWGLSNRVRYVTLWQWHTGACLTDYITSHCSSDVLGLVQCSTLHYNVKVTYCVLFNKVRYITLQRWHTGVCLIKYTTSHCQEQNLTMALPRSWNVSVT
jgi:hypothetical protein